MSNIKVEFLTKQLEQDILLILTNGFHLRGKLISFDGESILLETDQYDNQKGLKSVLILQSNISTYVPSTAS